jgi:diaminopimelate decarboxylase
MELLSDLITRNFGACDSTLVVGGKSVREIAEEFGTPLFVYDRGMLDRKLGQLQSAIPEFQIYYSVKANPNLAILRHFVRRGCGLEIASAGELIQALAAGCSPHTIVMAGPGKTDRDLELALSCEIGEVHIESAGEAARISALCRSHHVRGRVGIRVNPTAEVQGGAMRMGGKPAPFGVDEEEFPPLLRTILSDPFLEFCGIHLFSGTQILDSSVLLSQFGKGVQIARKAAAVAGRPLQTLDFGGGLGIPYFSGDRELDLVHLSNGVTELMRELRSDAHFRGTRFVVEPGRFLVGEAGIYVARIVDVKQSRGKRFLILDGGMNHHLAASGNLGQTIKRNYPVTVVTKLGQPCEKQVDIVGPLCTPLDTLGRQVDVPNAQVGDLVGIFQSGAYGRSASPLGFLSHDTPAEVWVDGGKASLIRSRGIPEDLMRDVLVPADLAAFVNQ